MRGQVSLWLFTGLVSLSMAGCGGGSPTVVSGKVTKDSQPAADVQLTFYPANSNVAAFSSTSAADGSFRLEIPAETTVEAGEYKVTATKYVTKSGAKISLDADAGMDIEQLKASGNAVNALPKDYATAQNTPLKITIEPGAEVEATLDIGK